MLTNGTNVWGILVTALLWKWNLKEGVVLNEPLASCLCIKLAA